MKKILIPAFLIIFISWFFIFAIFDTMIKGSVRALHGIENGDYDAYNTGRDVAVGLVFIVFFLFIDGVVFSLLLKFCMPFI